MLIAPQLKASVGFFLIDTVTMQVTNDFVQAWRAWRQSTAPYPAHLTNGVEHDLSHMESYLYGIGLDAIAGKSYDYSDIARRELADLNGITQRLESDAPTKNNDAVRNHIALIRNVWLELEKLVT